MTIAPQHHEAQGAIDLRTGSFLDGLDPGVRHLADRIGQDHPDIEHLRILTLVLDAHAVTADAPVQNYRLVLAERAVRERLRRERLASTRASASSAT